MTSRGWSTAWAVCTLTSVTSVCGSADCGTTGGQRERPPPGCDAATAASRAGADARGSQGDASSGPTPRGRASGQVVAEDRPAAGLLRVSSSRPGRSTRCAGCVTAVDHEHQVDLGGRRRRRPCGARAPRGTPCAASRAPTRSSARARRLVSRSWSRRASRGRAGVNAPNASREVGARVVAGEERRRRRTPTIAWPTFASQRRPCASAAAACPATRVTTTFSGTDAGGARRRVDAVGRRAGDADRGRRGGRRCSRAGSRAAATSSAATAGPRERGSHAARLFAGAGLAGVRPGTA